MPIKYKIAVNIAIAAILASYLIYRSLMTAEPIFNLL